AWGAHPARIAAISAEVETRGAALFKTARIRGRLSRRRTHLQRKHRPKPVLPRRGAARFLSHGSDPKTPGAARDAHWRCRGKKSATACALQEFCSGFAAGSFRRVGAARWLLAPCSDRDLF